MKRFLFLTITLFGFMVMVYSQTNPQREIRLNNSHNRVNEPRIFVVDYLMLDSATFFPIELQGTDIKKVCPAKGVSVIYVTTNLAVVLNGELLSTPKEKEKLAATQSASMFQFCILIV